MAILELAEDCPSQKDDLFLLPEENQAIPKMREDLRAVKIDIKDVMDTGGVKSTPHKGHNGSQRYVSANPGLEGCSPSTERSVDDSIA